jgi:tetratricopeptide (TPR) repeat protein
MPAVFLKIFKVDRLLRAGYQAWQRGELELAVETLEAALAERPELPEALYPLARALHELGRSRKALAILDRTIARERVPGAGVVHRALLRYDSGDDGLLREDIARLSPGSGLAPALEALTEARSGHWETARFPPPSLWNPEVAGRVLALLEERHAAETEPERDEFHSSLFVPAADPNPAGKAGNRGKPAPPAPLRHRREWLAALEGASALRRFEEVIRLWELRQIPEAWRGPLAACYRVFAHYATRPPSAAARVAREAALRHSSCADLHFLHGLCLVRCSPRAASHAFVRAARHNDFEVYGVIRELARHLCLPQPEAIAPE